MKLSAIRTERSLGLLGMTSGANTRAGVPGDNNRIIIVQDMSLPDEHYLLLGGINVVLA
jgi:hypothetical protein